MASPHVFFVASANAGAAATTVALGLLRALDRRGLRLGFVDPLHAGKGPARAAHFARNVADVEVLEPLGSPGEQDPARGDDRDLAVLDAVLQRYASWSAERELDAVVVRAARAEEGLADAEAWNAHLASALDAEVLLVAAPGRDAPRAFDERLARAARPFGGLGGGRVSGVIANKLGEPPPDQLHEALDGARHAALDAAALRRGCPSLADGTVHLVGAVPWNEALLRPRTLDVGRQLKAELLHAGAADERRVTDVAVVARTVRNMTRRLRPGTLIVTPGDRDDVLLAAAMAALNGVPLAGVLVTGDIDPDARILELAERAFQLGLPLLRTEADSYRSATRAAAIDPKVPIDDPERCEQGMDGVAEHLDGAWLARRTASPRRPRLSPAAFLHRLTTEARASRARIVLPEGAEPRVLEAAVRCVERGIARCVLLADPQEAWRAARSAGLTLPEGLDVVAPSEERRERYVAPLVRARRHRGVTEPIARELLQDGMMLATMMLVEGEADGLVAGADHTTAHTVRPALQLVRTREDARLVSSVFFMCLPDGVSVFADCAVNPDPDAEALADIALQSAASAEAFGIEPRVAMISYSTGTSGHGSDVDKVRTATETARRRRPDLLIDGPLQYDAAAVASVARSKAPDSEVAGRATVFVFPDLNTGNTTYKAVQRSAEVLSVGPMLQGLRRPVNDLSRGARVEDVIYTIALTAVQARAVRSAVPAA